MIRSIKGLSSIGANFISGSNQFKEENKRNIRQKCQHGIAGIFRKP